MRSGYRTSVVLFLLGLTSIAMLIWTTQLFARQRRSGGLVNALNDMQIQIATFHLWFEEALQGDLHEEITLTWGRIDQAIALAETILNGGKTMQGLTLRPTKCLPLRTDMEGIAALLTQLKSIARQRDLQPATSGIGSPLDNEFDKVFEEFIKKAESLEGVIERDLNINQTHSQHLLVVVLFAWALVVTAATAGLWTRERRREVAEEALQDSNEQLQTQTRELDKHRLHLLKLVEERTAELTAANTDLLREAIERRAAVEALQNSKDRFERLSLEFQTLLDSIPDSLALLSPELQVMWANRGGAAMFGKPIVELNGQLCCTLWYGDSDFNGGHPAAKTFLTGKAESALILAPDGSIRDTRAVPIRDELGRVNSVLEIATDVTEKMALQAEAQRVAHLASLGELAAGVAHEINNPINGIINYAQILIDDCCSRDGESEIPNRIKKEGNRIAVIVRSLLSFAHQSKTEKIPVRIHEIMSDTLALSGKQLEKDGIDIRLNIPENLPMIMGNHQQIEQVFLNIVNNARYALNQKYPSYNPMKILEISAGIDPIRVDSFIDVTFNDYGTGIPSVTMEKVRQPFFSTKPKGAGTGLGLSISHGIISDHGGRLVIRSIDGESTTVVVRLPIKEDHENQNPCC